MRGPRWPGRYTGPGNSWHRETGDFTGAVRALLEAGASFPPREEESEIEGERRYFLRFDLSATMSLRHPLARTILKRERGPMSDGREEREEMEKRREQEKKENREDRIDRGDAEEWEPERVDS